MDKRIWSLLPAVILSMVLVVSFGVGGCHEERDPQWTKAIEMMAALPSEIDIFRYVDVRRAGSDSIGEMKTRMDIPTQDFYGQGWDTINSVGFFSSWNDHFSQSSIYEGAFDGTLMVSALEGEVGFGPPSRFGSILMWTGDHLNIALIDRFIVVGNTERVQHCIEVAQGEREPLSDNVDATDVVRRLPEDDGFSVAVGKQAEGGNAGCLAEAMSFQTELTFTSRIVLKYEDVKSAKVRYADSKREMAKEGNPAGSKISRDGVFVTLTFGIDFREW